MDKKIYLPYSIERNVGLTDTITISGWGTESKTLDESEAAHLVVILINFLNKKDLENETKDQKR